MNAYELSLLHGYLNETLSEQQAIQLRELLAGSSEARHTLRTLATIDSRLTEWSAAPAASSTLAAECALPSPTVADPSPSLPRRWLFWLASAGALLLLGVQIGERIGRASERQNQQAQPLPEFAMREAGLTDNGVAVLVNAIDATWSEANTWSLGSIVPPGDFQLLSGMAEFEFYSGARLVVQGHSHGELYSSMHARVDAGNVHVLVPSHASGFRIDTPRQELRSEPGEFNMQLNAAGDCRLQVTAGAVSIAWQSVASPLEPQFVRHLAAGSGLSWSTSEPPVPLVVEREQVSPFEQLQQQSEETARQRYQSWQAWNQQLQGDPRIAVRYDFQSSGDLLRDSSRSAAHGTIIGCERTTGRWPEKGALEFKRPGDRVRIDIPGTFPQLTLTAWIRVDASLGRHQGLLLTDGFSAGHPHWQISPASDLRLGVGNPHAPLAPRGTTYSSDPVFTPQRIGMWTFIASAYDTTSDVVTHFFNGRQVGQAKLKYSQELTIGRGDIGNWGVPLTAHHQQVRNFVGRMDELTLWRVALTAEELVDIYQTSRP